MTGYSHSSPDMTPVREIHLDTSNSTPARLSLLGQRALKRTTPEKSGAYEVISFSNPGTGFEVTATKKFYELLGNFSKAKEAFREIEYAVTRYPFGRNNIDHGVTTPHAAASRVVHKVPEGMLLPGLIPEKQFAVKTFGTDPERAARYLAENRQMRRSTPAEQFWHTIELKRIQERIAPGGFFGLISPIEVYAALREPVGHDGTLGREWLLMEHVTPSRPITTTKQVVGGLRMDAFHAAQFPDLASILQNSDPKAMCPFVDIPFEIAAVYPEVAPYLRDLHSDNLLETIAPCPETGMINKHYKIIDIETDESVKIHP